jgi:hypothetical protein
MSATLQSYIGPDATQLVRRVEYAPNKFPLVTVRVKDPKVAEGVLINKEVFDTQHLPVLDDDKKPIKDWNGNLIARQSYELWTPEPAAAAPATDDKGAKGAK